MFSPNLLQVALTNLCFGGFIKFRYLTYIFIYTYLSDLRFVA